MYLCTQLFLSFLVSIPVFSTTDEQWVAPGLSVSTTQLIDYDDYGEVFRENSDDYVYPYVCFEDVDGSERWRATIVYSDRIVLFREGRGPVITDYDFPFQSVFFSSRGKQVFLYQSTEPGQSTEQGGLRINVETGEQMYFNSQWNGLPPGIHIANDNGSLIFSSNHDLHNSELFFLDRDLALISSIEVEGLGVASVSDDFFLAHKSNGLARFSSSGEIEWEEGDARSQDMAISPNGDFYLSPISFGTGSGLRLGSTSTGEAILDYSLPYPYTVCDKPVFSADGSSWMCTARGFPGNRVSRQDLLISGNTYTGSVTHAILPGGCSSYSLLRASETFLLLRRRQSSDHSDSCRRYMLLSFEMEPILVTKELKFSRIQLQRQTDLLLDVIDMNSEGSRLLYSDNNFLILTEIEG